MWPVCVRVDAEKNLVALSRSDFETCYPWAVLDKRLFPFPYESPRIREEMERIKGTASDRVASFLAPPAPVYTSVLRLLLAPNGSLPGVVSSHDVMYELHRLNYVLMLKTDLTMSASEKQELERVYYEVCKRRVSLFVEALRKAAPLYIARLESGHLDLETGLGKELLEVKKLAQDYARAQVRLLEGVCARLLGLDCKQKHGGYESSDFYLTANEAPQLELLPSETLEALNVMLRLQARRYLEKRIMIASMERDPAKLDVHYESIMGHCRPQKEPSCSEERDSVIYGDMLIYMFYNREQRIVAQMAASGV
jgi:hypothetical protein